MEKRFTRKWLQLIFLAKNSSCIAKHWLAYMVWLFTVILIFQYQIAENTILLGAKWLEIGTPVPLNDAAKIYPSVIQVTSFPVLMNSSMWVFFGENRIYNKKLILSTFFISSPKSLLHQCNSIGLIAGELLSINSPRNSTNE